MERMRLCYTRALVQCPKCRKSELDESGSCPVCDGKIQTDTRVAEARSRRARIRAGRLERHTPEPIDDRAQKGDQLPQWRLELNRRLQKIKQEREALDKKVDRGQLPLDLLQSRSDVPAQRTRVARKTSRPAASETGQPTSPEPANKLPYPVDVSSSEPEPVARAEAFAVPSPQTEESAPQSPMDPVSPLADSSREG